MADVTKRKLSLVIFSFIIFLHIETCFSALGQTTLNPLPQTPDYKATGVEYDDGGMGPLFNFARSFINTALPGDFPEDFIKGAIDDPGKVISEPTKILGMFKGYVAAIAVGILFIVIMPIVGTCFCCCRLCGNCGGNRHQKPSDSIHCTRRVFASIVFGLTVFTLVGNICTYVSNDRMTTALNEVGDIVDKNLDDIDTFFDHTVKQAEVLGPENLNITRKAILKKLDMETLKNDFTVLVVDTITNGALTKMEQNINYTVTSFEAVTAALKKVQQASNSCVSPCGLNPPTVISSTTESQFNSFKQNDPVKKVKEEIGTQISNNLGTLTTTRTDVAAAFESMYQNVSQMVNKIKDFKTKASNGIDIPKYKNDVKTYTETAKKYDQYRHTGGLALSGVITLIVSLQFFGLVFGSLGQGCNTLPTDRGCVSNSGGNFLIASVAFIFLFSWLLMLLTTITFAVGSLLERFVCQPLAPPDFHFLQIAESKFNAKDVLGASMADVLKDCQSGEAAYKAFHLEKKFDINTVDTKLRDQLKVINDKMQTKLQSLSTLGTGNAEAKASASMDQLIIVLGSITYTVPTPVSPSLLPADYRDALNELKSALDKLESIKSNATAWKNEFSADLSKVNSQISGKASGLTQQFIEEISLIAKQYVNDTKTSILSKVGQCTPLWNLYDSVIIVSFCKYIVDAFNGFWFSIGWCLFFFVPSIIFSVKLAKHYRTMEPDDEQPEGDGLKDFGQHLTRSNKVGHKDDPET